MASRKRARSSNPTRIDGPGDVDGLRRGDREALASQHPEQLVEHAYQRARIQGHAQKSSAGHVRGALVTR